LWWWGERGIFCGVWWWCDGILKRNGNWKYNDLFLLFLWLVARIFVFGICFRFRVGRKSMRVCFSHPVSPPSSPRLLLIQVSFFFTISFLFLCGKNELVKC
jgi:hypothetical protein